MSASRTTSFLRNAHNSPYANNLATLAKKATTDVVDTLVKNRQAADAHDDLNAAYLSRGSLFSDFGTDMDAFGLEELNDVPELYPGDGETYATDVFGAAVAAPAPSAMAPAPAPAVGSPFGASRMQQVDAEIFDFGSLAALRSQQQLMRSPRSSDASIGSAAASFAAPVKVKREDAARMSSSASSSATKKSRTGKTTSVSVMAKAPAPAPAPRRAQEPVGHHHDDEDLEEEQAYQAELATAAASGDASLIRQIKNGREKKRRARMCTKFEELHKILNVTNEMMARYTGVGLPSSSGSSGKKDAAGTYEKKAKFKKAQVLNNAVKTIAGMQQTFADMQAQIETLRRQNEELKQKGVFVQSI